MSVNHTLYIKNLNDKIRPDRMKKALYDIFSPFGLILQIENSKRKKLRGQAFIVFSKIEHATAALSAAQGLILNKKPITISYANTKSDVIARIDGTWKSHVEFRRQQKEGLVSTVKKMSTETDTISDSGIATTSSQSETTKHQEIDQEIVAPNHRLIIQNLPESITKDVLTVLFRQYDGFKDVRLAPSFHAAFVEYDSIPAAAAALSKAKTVKIGENELININFAK